MLDSVDHIIIAVEDLPKAINNYTKLLGFPPTWKGFHSDQGTENALFPLENLYIELLASCGPGSGSEMIKDFLKKNGEGIAGLAFGASDIRELKKTFIKKGIKKVNLTTGKGEDIHKQKTRTWLNLFIPSSVTRVLFTFFIQHKTDALPVHKQKFNSPINRLDHVVINTNDPEGVISLYRDTFGIRLALDQTVEKWGGRMLFFRLNHTTLEVIAKEDDEEPKDSFWGLAWVVQDIEATYKRLVVEGFEVSKIKEGRKPDTLVATVKSNTCNIPTLLIQHF